MTIKENLVEYELRGSGGVQDPHKLPKALLNKTNPNQIKTKTKQNIIQPNQTKQKKTNKTKHHNTKQNEMTKTLNKTKIFAQLEKFVPKKLAKIDKTFQRCLDSEKLFLNKT